MEHSDGQDIDSETIAKNTAMLSSAISSLPELQETKKILDKHTNIATALLGNIKERELDNYFALEESMISSGTVARDQLLL